MVTAVTKDRTVILHGHGYLVRRNGESLRLHSDQLRAGDVVVGLNRLIKVEHGHELAGMAVLGVLSETEEQP